MTGACPARIRASHRGTCRGGFAPPAAARAGSQSRVGAVREYFAEHRGVFDDYDGNT
jgi:hypothetical protein